MSEQSLQVKQQTSVFISALAGGVAGVIVDCVYYPFETIKTRIQASNKKVDYSKQAKDLNKYKGFSMQLFSSFPFAFSYFYTYDFIKCFLKKNHNQKDNLDAKQNLINFIAASSAETVANTFRTPFEVVKQQQQVGHDNLVRHTINEIYKTKGIRGFYAGFGVLLFRDIPFSAIQLPLYEIMKKGKQIDLTLFESVYSGAVAAAVAAFLTTPMDVVKSKMMTQRDNYYKNSFHCTRVVFQEEGIQAFFKGAVYRTLPMCFTGTIFFTVWEQAKNFFYRLQNKH
ncbi:Mitochondrial carrier domain [Pseudocohnilembus persalinus]|uniref:Mitochondrial carrier domain n=1 Tax=Pseudocohnilembus persalinus TaxID=266149 RepID=A0A0V0QFY9_PSEPJ|nr:Mitochondrial carrier domain [Pseudocohnilembus persalinus]|eukprot:KRX01139.1 Mitochondrial carrier domain [Pseudocohnilembus persalinus]